MYSIRSSRCTIAKMGVSMNRALQQAVIRQLQLPRIQKQIGRQLTAAIGSGRTSIRITVSVPAPSVTENRQRTNRGKPRFVLTGVSKQKTKKGLFR